MAQIKNNSKIEKIELDATGKSLGRLASEIAKILMGKHRPDFQYRLSGNTYVVVHHLDQLRFSGKKWDKKVYYHHTGYIGHLKETKLKELWQKNPSLVLKKAVLGMLPKNKLRAKRIKRLIIK